MRFFYLREIELSKADEIAKQLATNTLIGFSEADISVDVLQRFIYCLVTAVFSGLTQEERTEFLHNMGKAMQCEAVNLNKEVIH